MAADRTNTQQHAEHKPAGEEQGRSPGKLSGANSPARISYGAAETPAVSLSEGPTAGQGRGPGTPPVPSLPPRASAVPPAPRPAGSQNPVFTVTSFSASGAGNANTVAGADLYVESPLFRSSARVQSPAGVETANWDIGYIQTVTGHYLETRYSHTVQTQRVAVPIRDALAGTTPPWYYNNSKVVARPGVESGVSMDDRPFHHAAWNDPRTREVNALISTTRRFVLAAWLIARHRTRQTIIYLKNIVWGLNFLINVNSATRTPTNAGAGMTPPATGEGQGGIAPVLGGPIYNTAVNDLSNRSLVAGGSARGAANNQAGATAGASRSGHASAAQGTAAPASNGAAGSSPLPLPVQGRLSRSLGVDLRDVRVHSDSHAQGQAQDLSARAFTFGNHVFLGRGESANNVGLMAHEAAHVVQQRGAPAIQRFTPGTNDTLEREAHQVSAAVVRGESFQVQQRTTPRVQRLGISDALNFFANRANLIPGFRMFTIILGLNPINMSRVERSAANILRAIVEFIPGGGLITQALDNYGVFDRIGSWLEGQIQSLGISGSSIRQAITRFLDSLGWRDIFNLGGIWDRARRIFTDPIDRLIAFARALAPAILRFIKDAILRPLARLAENTRGYPLLKAVLGSDPITGEAVPRNAETLIGGFMTLIGQEEVWRNLQRANAVSRAWAWFQGALGGLLGFVRQIPSMFIQALRELEIADIVLLPRAFIRVGRVFAGFIGQFLSWAGQQVMDLLQIIFDVVAPSVMPYLRRAAGAFRTIIQNPVRFIGYLVRAGIQGFRQFATNFLTHLRASLIGWLTGAMSGANIYIPQGFNLREIIKFVLSVLGLTWQNIRQKLVRVMGEPAVRVLETTFDIVMTLVTQGPAAAWERIQESLSNLREMVMEQIMTFVRDRVVQAAITRLVTSLNPAGAFIQAIIATYNTVMFFVERLRQIAQVVASFIDSIAAIASGNITAAANRVEQTMAGLLTLVISFLARIAGLGRVSDAVTNIINRVRAPIDRALDRVVEWIRERAQRVIQRAAGGTPQQRLDQALIAALTVVNRFAGRRVGALVLNPLLGAIRIRFQLQSLEVFANRGRWYISGRVNPANQTPTEALVAELALGSVDREAFIRRAMPLAATGRRIARERRVPFMNLVRRIQRTWDTVFASTADGHTTFFGILSPRLVTSLRFRVTSGQAPNWVGQVIDTEIRARQALTEPFSHAETKIAHTAPNHPFGVTDRMCPDCRRSFARLATQRRIPQFVDDGTTEEKVFWPEPNA